MTNARVIIEVKAGVAYPVSIPVDVDVEVINHDCEDLSGIYCSQDSDTNILGRMRETS